MARVSFDQEKRLVTAFLGDHKGFFVEVGAKGPQLRSQTWRLEQAGLTGILVEPQRKLADKLRATRRAKVLEVTCSTDSAQVVSGAAAPQTA